MKYIFKLFIIGQTPISIRALNNFKDICETTIKGQYELQVIDILKEPHLAEEEKIIATPTLVKKLPPPVRAVIGDMSQKEEIFSGLEISLKRIEIENLYQ